MVVYFKRFIIVIIGVASFGVSFAVSIYMHPKVYRKSSPWFSKLRGGPAVGTALVSVASFANLETLRGESGDNCLTTNDIILALSMAFLSVGAGVLAADMHRGWKKEKK